MFSRHTFIFIVFHFFDLSALPFVIGTHGINSSIMSEHISVLLTADSLYDELVTFVIFDDSLGGVVLFELGVVLEHVVVLLRGVKLRRDLFFKEPGVIYEIVSCISFALIASTHKFFQSENAKFSEISGTTDVEFPVSGEHECVEWTRGELMHVLSAL